MQEFAKIISFAFHPLWMPLNTLLLVLNVDPYLFIPEPYYWFLMVVLIINTIAPALSIFVMYKMGHISSLEVEKRKQRFLPFILVTFYYAMSYGIVRAKLGGIQVEVLSLFSALIVTLVICMLISMRYKISMHLMAHGALFGVLIALGMKHAINVIGLLLCVTAVSALVAWARIKLRVHLDHQTLAGWSLGGLVHFLFVYFAWFI